MAFDLLAETLAGRFRVIAIDLAGHGAARGLPGPYSFTRYIGDLAAQAAVLKREPFHLLGWSMGGVIAARYVLERMAPKPRSLILISAPARFVAPKEEAETGLRASSVRRQMEFLERDHEKGLAGFIEMFFMTGERIDPANAAMIREKLKSPGQFPPAREALLETLAELAATDLTRHTSIPMAVDGLIIHGGLDKICPAGGQALWDDIFTGMRRAPMGDCGHAPHLTRPAETAAAITGFISELR